MAENKDRAQQQGHRERIYYFFRALVTEWVRLDDAEEGKQNQRRQGSSPIQQ